MYAVYWGDASGSDTASVVYWCKFGSSPTRAIHLACSSLSLTSYPSFTPRPVFVCFVSLLSAVSAIFSPIGFAPRTAHPCTTDKLVRHRISHTLLIKRLPQEALARSCIIVIRSGNIAPCILHNWQLIGRHRMNHFNATPVHPTLCINTSLHWCNSSFSNQNGQIFPQGES